jgi:flagellar hook-associated protein 3 FlgL
MRITQRAITQTSLQGLNRNLAAVGKLQEQLTSGRTITKPSDSPTGTNRAMQTRQDSGAVAQQARNISDGKGWLDATDTTLQSALNQTRVVRNLTVQASNTGAISDTAAQGIKAQVEGLRASLVGLANTVVQGRPIFGGVTSGSTAYTADGTFVGRAGAEVTRRVSDSEAIRIDITGPEAFGEDPATNLFATIDKIIAAVGSRDSTGLSEGLGALDKVMNGMATALADIGTRAARMDTAGEVNAGLKLTMASQLADIENVDLPKTLMELRMQETGYQAALQATAQVIQPTLLDFLR